MLSGSIVSPDPSTLLQFGATHITAAILYSLRRLGTTATLGDIMAEAEVFGGHLVTQASVFQHIEQGLLKNPDGLAVISTHQSARHLSKFLQLQGKTSQPIAANQVESQCLTMTYGVLHEAAQRLAFGIIGHEVAPGSVVLLLIPNGGEYCIFSWACIISRLTYVCLDPASLGTSGADDVVEAMKTLRPQAVVVPDNFHAERLDQLLSQLDSTDISLRVILGDETPKHHWKSLEDLITHAPIQVQELHREEALARARDDEPSRVHSVIYTSGTSGGPPKGCPMLVRGMSHVLHSQSWLIDEHSCARAIQQAHNSRGIAPAQTLQTWKEGGAVVMTGQRFSVEDLAREIPRHRATFIVLTPPMVHSLGQLLASRPFDVSSVKRIQLGGDAITKSTLLKCAALFPEAEVCINHGMTEGGGAFVWPFFGTQVSDIPFFGEICPVGRVAPGAAVRIWDTAEGRVCRLGEAGELHICCGSIIPRYLNGESDSSFYNDGDRQWFNTKDVGMITDRGLVFILGRCKDVIRRDGVVVPGVVLESCIEAFIGEQASFALTGAVLT